MSTSRRALFGINVRMLREAKGVSQESFAEACGLHRTYIGSIERGERNISIDNMERVASALAIDLPDLLRPREDVIRAGAHASNRGLCACRRIRRATGDW